MDANRSRIVFTRRSASRIVQVIQDCYINKTEFDILHDCIESYVEEGVREVCIVANEVRSISPLLERDVIGLGQLGLTLRFQQLAPSIQRSLENWGLQAWIDDE